MCDMLYVFFLGCLGEWRLKLDQIFFSGWRMLKTKISTLKEIHDMRANSFGKVKHFGFGWLAGCDTCQFQSPSFKHARLCFFLVMFSSTGISRTLTCLISSSRIKCTNRLQNLLYVWYTNVKTNIKLYTAWGLPWILWTHLWATEQITQHRGVMFFLMVLAAKGWYF